MRIHLAAISAVLILASVACSAGPTPPPSPSLRPGEIALTAVQLELNGAPVLCAGGGFVERVTLHGAADAPGVTWLEFDDGTDRRETAVWPQGYRARFVPDLEVLDERGDVVAREGDVVEGGCPMPPGGMMVSGFSTPR